MKKNNSKNEVQLSKEDDWPCFPWAPPGTLRAFLVSLTIGWWIPVLWIVMKLSEIFGD